MPGLMYKKSTFITSSAGTTPHLAGSGAPHWLQMRPFQVRRTCFGAMKSILNTVTSSWWFLLWLTIDVEWIDSLTQEAAEVRGPCPGEQVPLASCSLLCSRLPFLSSSHLSLEIAHLIRIKPNQTTRCVHRLSKVSYVWTRAAGMPLTAGELDKNALLVPPQSFLTEPLSPQAVHWFLLFKCENHHHSDAPKKIPVSSKPHSASRLLPSGCCQGRAVRSLWWPVPCAMPDLDIPNIMRAPVFELGSLGWVE